MVININNSTNPYDQPILDPELQKTIDRISEVTGLAKFEVQKVLKEYFDIYEQGVFASLNI